MGIVRWWNKQSDLRQEMIIIAVIIAVVVAVVSIETQRLPELQKRAEQAEYIR